MNKETIHPKKPPFFQKARAISPSSQRPHSYAGSARSVRGERFESFFDACRDGRIDEVGKMLENEQISRCCMMRDSDGQTPLHIACLEGHHEVVKLLLRNSELGAKDKRFERTPLHKACASGHVEVVELLLLANADIDAQDRDLKRPGDLTKDQEIQQLLTYFAKGNLQRIWREGAIEEVKEILEFPFSLRWHDMNGNTGLHEACQFGRIEVVELLIGHRAKISSQNYEGDTPLHKACEFGHAKIVQLLIAKKAKKAPKNSEGNTPFHKACEFGHTEIVEMLVAAKARSCSKNSEGDTPLHLACRNNHRNTIALLLIYNCPIEPNSQGKTPLEVSAPRDQLGHKALFRVYYERRQCEIQLFDVMVEMQIEQEKLLRDAIMKHKIEDAKRMMGSDQDLLHLGALYCLSRRDLLYFFKELQIRDYDEIRNDVKLSGVVLDVRNKEAFEYMLKRGGGDQKLFEYLKRACMKEREDRLEWLLEAFSEKVKKLPLKELFYYSKGDCTSRLLQHLLSDDSPELKQVFCGVCFSSSVVKIPPSQLITTKVVDLFPWRSMAQTLTHLDLSDCGLTDLPKGICYLDHQKVVEINLEGNPFSDVVNAVVRGGGNPKDIILLVAELKGGGVELKEKKVLVVGDAAVGKTTLLRGLRGEKEVAAKVATDGIEIGELRLEGVVLNCWDFAGQEVYRYTHQLFLSDSSVYLVLFDLSQPIRSIYLQLTYWLDSITNRAPASQAVLVGTHASIVSKKRKLLIANQVGEKFREYMRGETLLMVDSVSGEGLDMMKKTLSEVASQNLPRVPRLFEDIRESFQKYQDDCGGGNSGYFVEADKLKEEIEKSGVFETLTNESWEWSLRILDCLGSIVLVNWDRYIENRYSRCSYVILRPSWLVDVFKTVVTMQHNVAKGGVVLIEKLQRGWEGVYDSSMHDLLFEALEKFDVLHRLSGKRGEGKVIVPCLLPNCAPDNFSVWVQNEKGGLGCFSQNGGTDKCCSSSTFRRSFLLKKEKNNLPIGVMGKILSSMFQWGKVQYAWRTGCVITCGDDNNVVVAMWKGWCGRRVGVHFVFYAEEKSSSSSRGGSYPPSLNGSMEKTEKSGLPTVKGLLQQSSQVMGNLLEDFYKVDYEAVIPCCVDSEGIPIEWMKVNDVLVSLYQGEPKVRVMRRAGGVGRDVVVGGLAPDLVFGEETVRFFDEDSIVLGRLLGTGGFSEVWEGEVSWDGDAEGRQTKKVAVKKVLLDKASQTNNLEEILTTLHHEAYLSLQVRHPNVVQLVGMCSQTKPPLLLLELLDGDLYSSLMDPLDLESTLKKFFGVVGMVVQKGKSWDEVLSSCPGACEDCNSLFEKLCRIFGKCHPIKQQADEFISNLINYVNHKTKSACDIWVESQAKLLDAYQRSLNEIAPLSFTGVLRIAADISQGIHYLHSHEPSLIHRDLKAPNIFLTRSFMNGGGTKEYASQNIVAKLGDFGLSSVLCGPYQLRSQGKMNVINQRWVAPEILGGRHYSTKSDIYSLGLTFWEIRYRELVYSNLRDDLFPGIIRDEVLQGTRPELQHSDAFDEIMKNCWSSLPSERFTAGETYSCIRTLSSYLSPSLFCHLPSLSVPSADNPNHFSLEGKLKKRIKLRDGLFEEKEKHRVTCITIREKEVWGGCESGFVFCYCGDDEEEGKEKRGRAKEEKEVIFCHYSQLLGGVNAIAAEKDGLVWVGGEDGMISVWKSGCGAIYGEEVNFSAPLLHGAGVFNSKKTVESLFKLEYGEVRWKERKKKEEERLLMDKVKEVKKIAGKRGTKVVLVEEGGEEREFELGGEEGQRGLECLKFALFCLKRETVLKRVGELDLGRRVMGLEMVGGTVWSFDESHQIREWNATPDATGNKKGTYTLLSVRSFDLGMLQLSLPSFSCFFGVGDKEIHMIFNRLVVVLERTSPLEDEKGEGAVAFQRKLDFFDETEEKEGEVWCGVYFGLREEVWVGTSEGWIWRKGATMLEKRKVVGGVTAMAVVGSQIWCGTNQGRMYRFEAMDFSLIQENEEKEEISSFGVVSEGTGVWLGSLEGSISLWA